MIPEQDRVITQVVILDADKKQIQCVVRPLQILNKPNISNAFFPAEPSSR
ncbi:TPA: hypothetical protein JWI92_002929 [Escherichia coli]|nr:hypothetical protein [Escherichia coli]HBB2331856.1 hypothetical protein [Escherichia coli]